MKNRKKQVSHKPEIDFNKLVPPPGYIPGLIRGDKGLLNLLEDVDQDQIQQLKHQLIQDDLLACKNLQKQISQQNQNQNKDVLENITVINNNLKFQQLQQIKKEEFLFMNSLDNDEHLIDQISQLFPWQMQKFISTNDPSEETLKQGILRNKYFKFENNQLEIIM